MKRRYNLRTCLGNANGKGYCTNIFNFRLVHFWTKTECTFGHTDAYDLHAITTIGTIYILLTDNPVQETAVQHNRDSSMTAQLQLQHGLAVMRRATAILTPNVLPAYFTSLMEP